MLRYVYLTAGGSPPPAGCDLCFTWSGLIFSPSSCDPPSAVCALLTSRLLESFHAFVFHAASASLLIDLNGPLSDYSCLSWANLVVAAVVGSVLGTTHVLGTVGDPLPPRAMSLALSDQHAAILVLGDTPYCPDDRDFPIFLRRVSPRFPPSLHPPPRIGVVCLALGVLRLLPGGCACCLSGNSDRLALPIWCFPLLSHFAGSPC